jgi:hypothetical protein
MQKLTKQAILRIFSQNTLTMLPFAKNMDSFKPGPKLKMRYLPPHASQQKIFMIFSKQSAN